MFKLRGHKGKGMCVAFSPDGRILASGSADKTIRLWRAGTKAEIATASGHTQAVVDLAFSSDGKSLVSSGADNTLRLWDVATHQEIGQFHGNRQSFWRSLAVSPDGTTLAAGIGGYPQPGIGGVYLWQMASRKESGHVDTKSQEVWDIAFSPDGQTLAMACQGDGLVLHDLRSGGRRTWSNGRVIRDLAFSPDGKTIAAATAWDVELWDVAAGEMRQTLTGHRNLVWAVAYSADGRLLLSGGKDDSVRVWDAPTGALIEAFDWGIGGINSVAITPDGTLAATCGTRRGVVVWDLG